jgi:beta-N-acetylhexosaminidase
MKQILAGLLLFFTLYFSARADTTWVDSVFRSLTPDQRIAQLMIIRAWGFKDSVYDDSLTNIIRKYNPGGVCFFKATPVHQAQLTNRLQDSAATPLLIATDAEWGLGMRLDSAFSFPRQMALGALQNDSLIYQMGRAIARDCKRMGIHINFAPVVDINNNPMNPVIGFRSFGENREAVAKKGALIMHGMQDAGIMATAKHFPGHGDTDTDSHLTLPVINHTSARMDSVELYPFKALIREGVKGVMTGHLYVPCYDTTKDLATTLSPKVVTTLLKDDLGFLGFAITDALDMKGVTKYHQPGAVEVKALLAGNDILLLPENLEMAIAGIRTAIDSGRLMQSDVDQRCRKILQLKFSMGLDKSCPVNLNNLTEDLNPVSSEVLMQEIVDESITLVKNDIGIVPLTGLERRKIAVVSLGDTNRTGFQRMAGNYCDAVPYNLPVKFSETTANDLIKKLSAYDILLLGIHRISSTADSFALSRQELKFIDTLTRANRVILVVFGTPYALRLIPGIGKAEALLVAYQDNPATGAAAAQVVFGGLPARGQLPVSASVFNYGTGEQTTRSRLSFVAPEALGIPRAALSAIDSIALSGIAARAYPGCQVLFAKNGAVFYSQAFGHARYEDTLPVTTHQLYDLASITKVAATTLAIMKLTDESKLSPDDTLGKFLPGLKGSNKASLKIGDVLAHQAGLQPWIPFFKKTVKNGKPDPAIYQPERSKAYPVRVAEFLYIRKDYADSIYKTIIESPLRSDRDYKYSDLGFYLLRLVVEEVSGKPFTEYLNENFYKPMGLKTMGFTPRDRFELSELIPTEYDTQFRMQLIRGDVHDPGAAMLGGISGHAGLFSNAQELAVVFQMLLQNGTYGEKRYVSEKSVSAFTARYNPGSGNRRGVGFDKPPAIWSADGPACSSASGASFGHSGFTGTYVWADPSNNLLYVFLSNRIHPDAGNQKLSQMNIRTDIHQTMYEILKKYRVK